MKQREIKNWFENFKPRNILTQHIKYLEYVKRKSLGRSHKIINCLWLGQKNIPEKIVHFDWLREMQLTQ